MPTSIRNKYHIAINTVGYMLRGAPNSPAYTRSVVPSQVNRLAISDLNYSDFAGTGLFYTAQTSWSSGIKSEPVWRDDGKYYYSTNIDAYSSQGELKAEFEVSLHNTFDERVYCGGIVSVAGSEQIYVGTRKLTAGNIKIYKYDGSSWTDVAGTTFSTNQNLASYVIGHKENLWVGTVGTGGDDFFKSYDGSTWTTHKTAINTAAGFSALASRAACELGGILYVGVENYAGNECAIVSTDDTGSTWALAVDLSASRSIVSMADYNGQLYYLATGSNRTYLRVYDPVSSTDTEVESFSQSVINTSVWDKALKVFGGKLIITLSSKIFEYDGQTLLEIYKKDAKKIAIGNEANVNLSYGCVEKDSKLYWGNLIYDGESFFNFKKPLNDGTNLILTPFMVDLSEKIFYSENLTNDEEIYADATTYKSTTSKNFIVFNEMAPVVSIDKLLYSITAIFQKMVSGDEIKIEYSINNRSTWVTAGTLTYSTEGGTNTMKEIVIPGNIIFNKIWWKVSIANTGGATSPVLSDLIMAYRPMPNYKNRWQMRLNMSDGVKLLNKQNDDREGDDMNSQLWNEKLAKRRVKFQDIDYAECTLKTAMSKTQTSALITSVKKLPEQGRLRAVSGSVAEEMYYTSAKTDRILGIVRGVRGTTARAYLSGQVLDNGYDVYVEDITTSLNFTDEEKTESVAQVLLIES